MTETDEERARRRYRTVAHLFWFEHDPDPSKVQVSIHHNAPDVGVVAAAVMRKAEEHGYEPQRVSRTFGDELVAVEFRVPNKSPHEHMPMPHRFCRLDEPWPTSPEGI